MRFLAWYINAGRLGALLDVNFGASAQLPLSANSGARADQMEQARRAAESLVKSPKIQSINELASQVPAPGSRILASIWTTFSFRDIGKCYKASEKNKTPFPATMKATWPWGKGMVTISGSLYAEHLYSFSSIANLTNKKLVYVLGIFEFPEQPDEPITVNPLVIGELLEGVGALTSRYGVRVYPDSIDCFAKVRNETWPSKSDVEIMRNIPESFIKEAFARIIGEAYVSKDWGGEKSDLYSARLSIDGVRVSAAFAFKGPAKFRSMDMSMLGKRGDQLIRLFSEPADLLVVQNAHSIDTAVIKHLEALALDPRNPRKFCAIDGVETLRILRAYGEVPKA